MSAEVKTGQSIDVVKESLLETPLVERVVQIAKENKNRILSVIDFGAGDASFTKKVINRAVNHGVCIDNLALIETDTAILPDMLSNTLPPEIPSAINVQIVESKSRNVVDEFLKQYGEKFDVAIFQLVNHQIIEDAKMSHLMLAAHKTLKMGGSFFLVDLHPKFIDYLSENEPNKFETGTERGGIGEYHFDSGGVVRMKNRKIIDSILPIVGMGHDVVRVTEIYPDAISTKKERYKQMTDNKIPMFYSVELKKNEDNLGLVLEGVIREIRPVGERSLFVSFYGDENITIPRFEGWEGTGPEDVLQIVESHRPGTDFNTLNFWVTPSDQNKKMVWDQMTIKV